MTRPYVSSIGSRLVEDELLERSGAWLAARAIAGRYFGEPDVKFITNFKFEGRWTAVQWVTTSYGLFGSAVQVYPGRVATARLRRRAFRLMTQRSWRAGGPKEPQGATLGVQVYARIGKPQ